MSAVRKTKHDHSRHLCGKPDLTGYGLTAKQLANSALPRHIAKGNPPPCRCCGTIMEVQDCSSDDMTIAGAYWLQCPKCPTSKQATG